MKETVIGFDALYESKQKCIKGVSWKDSVMHFDLNAIEEVMKLECQLKSGDYQQREPKHFKVTIPKERDVISISIRDRVYQRSLNDNEVYPEMTRHFIYDNWACQKGKGTDAARDRLKEFLRKAYRKHGKNLYVLQCDIHGYYPNMRHDVAENTFHKYLDEESFHAVREILSRQYQGQVGYNPGSQIVQIAGISVLNDIDHYIKERLHVKHYLRYMDDFILIHNDEYFLEECKNDIERKLEEIGFSFNPKKTKIFGIDNGILFLGWIFKLTDTGKVLMLVNPEKIKEKRRMYKRLVKKCRNGEVPRNVVDESYFCFRQNLTKGNCYHLLKRMDEYYRHLWEESQ